ncbi:MAG: hypothetical protein Q4B09_06840 [Lachnospiraceae bacterium]|nr:hypothetical protein [Lachnospiraceae bacterium]
MTEYSPIESGWSFLVKTFSLYQKPGFFLFLAAAGLLLTFFFGRRKGRVLFVYPSLLLLLTVFNPYFYTHVLLRLGHLTTEYYRLLWALPLLYAAAYGFTSLLSREKKALRAAGGLLAGAMVIFLLITAAPPLSEYVQQLQLPADELLFDQELQVIADYIMDVSGNDEPVTAFEEEAYRRQVREYNAAIMVSPLFSGNAADADELREELQRYLPDYIVLRRDGETAAMMSEIGLRMIGYTDDHLICVMER